ncbi:hypothetical protein [Leptothoe kymatousa]|uniref:DUF4168 domain-containing protein n=1 Tax=Leptothoe kymatousa TAU-MAC 1615 TaxID=2364775 RepID=A0ABS5Y485_9CYAN|nr:hypothetical protein [Leptothoe kymatousa]MBT9312649.1 hypothetical protein [Leptothoe kymatousa TAU-MAC 1615]
MKHILLGIVVVMGCLAPAEASPTVLSQPGSVQASPGIVKSSLWADYTPRQRAIAVAVAKVADAYYAQTATPLPVTPETVAMVLQAIEAEPVDAAFIYDRMAAHSFTRADISQVDVLLDRVHRQIQAP